jgi:hypothetical protein
MAPEPHDRVPAMHGAILDDLSISTSIEPCSSLSLCSKE